MAFECERRRKEGLEEMGDGRWFGMEDFVDLCREEGDWLRIGFGLGLGLN